MLALVDAVVAGDHTARVERAEAGEEPAAGDDAAPALARARSAHDVEGRGEAQEDQLERVVGDVVHRRRRRRKRCRGVLAAACHGHLQYQKAGSRCSVVFLRRRQDPSEVLFGLT